MSPQISELKRGCGRAPNSTQPMWLAGGTLFCSQECTQRCGHHRAMPFFTYPDRARCGDTLAEARKRETPPARRKQ